MRSQKVLPIRYRVKNGIYKKPFKSGDNFENVQNLCKKYHQALEIAEKEIEQLDLHYNSDVVYPKELRKEYHNMTYIGVSKFVFSEFVTAVKRCHQQLEYAETVLNLYSNKITE